MHFFLAVAGLSGSCGSRRGSPQEPADLVLRGGRIVTLDDNAPEAEALAARNGRIVAIGTQADIAPYLGPSTQVIDLNTRFAMPGFIEGHGHFLGIGENRVNLDLARTSSWDEIVQAVAEAVARARPGQWIVGRGWHQEKWTSVPAPNVEGFPVHESLDKVSPENPVVLTHASGHAAFVNAKAMQLSAIDRTTANPTGGEIVKDARGNPTGLLRETAAALVRRGAGEPRPTAEEAEARARRALELADQEVVSKGITSFHDAGASFDVIARIKRLVDEDRLHVRLWEMVRMDDAGALVRGLDAAKIIGYRDNRLTVRAIKVQIDGALGSRGAWLLDPYTDKPDSAGLNTTPVETVRATAQAAIEHGYQMAVHAIGDRANREVLDIYDETFRRNGKNGRELRWRIEHAQHLAPSDIPRFAEPRRDRVDADRARHLRRPVCHGATRPAPRRGGRVRLAEPHEGRGARRQRHRCAGRERGSDRELLRGGHAKDGVWSRSEDEPARSAAIVHGQQRIRGVRRGCEGDARPSASWPTSPC